MPARRLLYDLGAFAQASQVEVEARHYTVERIIELPVAAASDLLFHLLAERGVQPGSYREAFRLAGREGLLPAGLAERLQLAAVCGIFSSICTKRSTTPSSTRTSARC